MARAGHKPPGGAARAVASVAARIANTAMIRGTGVVHTVPSPIRCTAGVRGGPRRIIAVSRRCPCLTQWWPRGGVWAAATVGAPRCSLPVRAIRLTTPPRPSSVGLTCKKTCLPYPMAVRSLTKYSVPRASMQNNSSPVAFCGRGLLRPWPSAAVAFCGAPAAHPPRNLSVFHPHRNLSRKCCGCG